MSSVLPTSWPPGWEARPAWDVLQSRDEFGGRAEQLSLSVASGVRARNAAEGRAASESTDHYRRVCPGDLVINRLVARDGAIAVSALHGRISPAYWVLKPRRHDDDVRFIAYQLRSSVYLAEIVRISKAMPPAQFDLPWDQFRRLPIALPRPATQRVIADFLDTETARIDALIAKKQRLSASLKERFAIARDHEIFDRDAEHVVPQVKWVADLLPGYAYSSEDFLDDGDVRLLRGINIAPGSLRWEEAVWGDKAIALSTARFRLRVDDLVLGMDRPVISSGVRVAMVAPHDLPAQLVQRVMRLRPHDVDARYLFHALSSARFAEHLEPETTGVSVPHVSGEQVGSFRIPLPAIEVQRETAGELDLLWERTSETVRHLNEQVDLLRDHRQALITAAVTGELEVPGVAA